MSEVLCLQVHAFTDRPFSGNPAAVCLFEGALDAAWRCGHASLASAHVL